MMRRIKFRGKSADGKWHYGDLLHIDGGTLIYHGSHTKSDDLQGSEEVAVELLMNEVAVCLPDTIGQFTGCVDKNGHEIYEDDVVLLKDNRVAVVKYQPNLYGFYADFHTLDQWNMEIIGNIHDDPKYNR